MMSREDYVCDCDIIHSDVVNSVQRNMPQESELYDLSDFFKVLGDSTRVKIMWALDEHELCVCDLAALLNMTKSAISHQLRALREANLVINRRDGKNIYYALADHHVQQIFEMGLEHIRETCSRTED
ncbi:MAG: metalloregulator ArsR/SmtB family transcription factor [Christensenella sp.]|nr:metalloregulator ArsR/SmtB family transcription factor [Christensenella sp.]